MNPRSLFLAAFCAAFSCIAAAAPVAAAAPANDDFANREKLSGSLPIEVMRSNVGATKEAGEFIPSGPAPAGHSIWFEWEAPSAGWFTVGACEDAFPTILAIFTGTEVNHLTQVVSDNAAEGPDCMYGQRQFTFWATAGSEYEIAVDGNVFHLPESPPPVTEGDVALRIEATPPPVNDDFGHPTALVGSISEEPGGRRLYFASTRGYNWGASKESGEPDHGGNPGGASVWYSWVAPESGRAHLSACCGPVSMLGVYVGDVVTALTPEAIEPGSPGLAVVAGSRYSIALDGNSTGGGAAMGSFQLLVSMELPTLDLGDPKAYGVLMPADEVPPPDTRLQGARVRPAMRQASFTFASSVAATFRCSLDGRSFAACRSPKAYRHLRPGRHRFRVVAVNGAGVADPSPATRRFSIGARGH